MVLVFLGNLQFEAAKFETRTMPTPNMKVKEMIYWIRVESKDRRIVSDLENFLKSAPEHLDLRVPSAFMAASVELLPEPVDPVIRISPCRASAIGAASPAGAGTLAWESVKATGGWLPPGCRADDASWRGNGRWTRAKSRNPWTCFVAVPAPVSA